ncbi:MAG: S-layer homology domain-containing protein, partial [Agathobaculum butyriciproducens]
MKRRLLSAFLAVMMVLTMAPVAFAADTATSDGEALSKLFTDVHAGESGSGNVTVTIDKDYDLTGYQWTSLTVQGYTGAGVVTVEGNNHKITGLNAPLFAGGFAGTSGIVVKNLTLTKVTIKDSTSDQGIGAFINNVDAMPKIELNNCHLTNSTITSTGGARVGGLIGWTSGYNKKNDGPVDTYITVTNCSVENTKITAAGSVGGIIGHAGANPATFHTFENNTITNCTLNSTDNGDWRVGVVVGTANVGEVALNNTTESGNTVTQTGKTAPAGQSNLYGRFVPGTTGKLVIDGTAVFDSSIVAVVDNKGYKMLADAVAAAQGGATVKLLKDVTEDVVIPADKTITLDLNGKKLTNKTGHTITVEQGATLTINGKGTVDNVTHQKTTIYNKGTVTLNGGTYDRSKEDGIGGSNTYYTLLNHGTMTVANVTVNNEGGYSSLFENGYFDYSKSRDGIDNPTLTIESGTFTGGINTVKNDDGATMTINGGIFTNYAQSAFQNHNIATINGGTFNGATVYAILNCGTGCKSDAAPDLHQLTITDGNFNGKIYKGGDSKDGTHYDIGSISITGGYFTTDPSAYVASDYVAGTSDVSGYSYKVVAKTNTGSVEVKPDVADPEVKVSDSISKEDQAKVAAAAATVSAPTLGAAATDEAQKIDKTKADELVAKATEVAGNTADKKLYVQSSLKVEPTAYDAANKTLALEITPQYRVVASTATTADEIKLDKNAQVVQDYQPMNITKATVVTMELPDGFAVDNGAKLSIQHTKSNGTVEYYTGTVTEQNGKHLLTFTTNGFSPFVISVPAASIGENVYPTLQAAVENVKNNNETIKLAKDVDEATVVTVAKSIKFTVNTDGKKFDAAKNIVAGSNTTVKVTGESSPYTYEFTYTKPSSGGSSGGSSSGKTTYKVTTSAVNNGGVNASPSNAEKGAAITITLSPDKGYKLDKLTVTDGSGKTVSTVKKSDTVYTFTMPASAVKVGVSYVKATETPSETKFNDVSANDWFASAVDYVTGKGMMNGTADNTFSPKANTTRGMVVTVLYRLENQPSTSAASFTDVASGAYYANA